MFKTTKLKNGINLVKIPIKGTKATTVLALFPVGSRYENEKISGIFHFIEHMMFKGTEAQPTALHISRQLEAVGADYNAYTSEDYTGYYIKIDSAKQELAYDLLSDMLFHSKFAEEEANREKGVIIEELRMYEDNPTMAVDQLIKKAMFGSHPVGFNIGGTKETVSKTSRTELCLYYKKYYIPQNMVLAIAGRVPQGMELRKCLEYFDKETPVKAGVSQLINGYAKFSWTQKKLAERVMVKEKKIDQAHVAIGFPGINCTDHRLYALSVLLHILGVGMSSRLFVEVRERRGLAYMIQARHGHYRDTGAVEIKAGLDPARLQEAFQVIFQELDKIVRKGVTVQELRDAKSSIAGSIALAAEDSSMQADWYAKHFWFSDSRLTLEQELAKLEQVSLEQAKRAARQIFKFEQMRVAAIGPLNKNKALKILRGLG